MSDVRSLLREAIGEIIERDDALQETIRTAKHRQRRVRLTALVTALVVGASGISVGAWAILRTTRVTSPLAPSCPAGWQTFALQGPGNARNELNGISALSSTDIWAVGDWVEIPSQFVSPRPVGGGLSSGPVFPTLTSPLIEHWDGKEWIRVPSPNAGVGLDQRGGSGLKDVAGRSPNDVWAVGGGGYPGPLIEHWDGTRWSIVSSPSVNLVNDSLDAVAADATNDAWAIGSGGPGPIGPRIEHWDGQSWSLAEVPHPRTGFSTLADISADSPTDAWAVGIDGRQSLVLHWDGRNWNAVSSPQVRVPTLTSVAALSPDDVWVTGYSAEGKNRDRPLSALLEHWDGNSWSVVPLPMLTGESDLNQISAAGLNDIWVMGSDGGSPNTEAVPVLLHYDGRSWSRTTPLPDTTSTRYATNLAAIHGGPLWLIATDASSYPEHLFAARYCR